MGLSIAEKQQINTAIDTFLESPTVQAAATAFITNVEGGAVKAVDAIVNNAKVGGLLGGIFNALKSSGEAELNTFVASLPPAAITALLTKDAEGELKTLLGV